MPWTAKTETRRTFVDTEDETEDGTKVKRLVMIRRIILTSDSGHVIEFGVSKRKTGVSITDNRETLTGFAGTSGKFGTREQAKAGNARRLTPPAWIREVTRYIGEDRAKAIIGEL